MSIVERGMSQPWLLCQDALVLGRGLGGLIGSTEKLPSQNLRQKGDTGCDRLPNTDASPGAM